MEIEYKKLKILIVGGTGFIGSYLNKYFLGVGATVDDVISAIDFIIKHPNLNGPFNLTAPIPVTNQLFSQTLADILHRPLFLRFPDVVVKCLFGEMGKALLLNG